MKKLVCLVCCIQVAFFALSAAGQAKTETSDKRIKELTTKFFRFSDDRHGKPSLVLIPQPDSDTLNKAFGDSCDDTFVWLTSPEAAFSIPGTSLILAFLECPATRGFEYDAIVTLFDRGSLNKPLCFSRLYLMSRLTECSYYYYGGINSLEVRKASDDVLHVLVNMEGGDGGDHWTSIALLRIDMDCGVTVLSRLYEGFHCTESCEGTDIAARFIDDKTVETLTKQFKLIEEGQEEIVKKTRYEYDLEQLYKNPRLRVFPSETEKEMPLPSVPETGTIAPVSGTRRSV